MKVNIVRNLDSKVHFDSLQVMPFPSVFEHARKFAVDLRTLLALVGVHEESPAAREM